MIRNDQKQGTVKVLHYESRILQNNPLDDPFRRDLYVYLPHEYEENPDKNYSTVYCLAGFTGRGQMMLNDSAFAPNMAERLDKLIGEKIIKPMIVIMPDCFTYYGGSQYINSSATGRYEDYLIKEIVPFVDGSFRTVRDKNSRAVCGKSSGGYGALIMAMRHSNVFGLSASIAGDCYFEMCYKPDFAKAFRAVKGNPRNLLEKFWNEEETKGKNDFDGLNIIGMSACYSPNQNSEWNFDLPFDLETGEIRADIWEKWLENDPLILAEKYAENLKTLKLLFLDAGTQDEFALDIGARVLSKKLKKLDVPHIHEEFTGGHFNINYRYNRTFELISEHLETMD